MTTNSDIRAQYIQLIGAGFLIFVLVFVSRISNLALKSGYSDFFLFVVLK